MNQENIVMAVSKPVKDQPVPVSSYAWVVLLVVFVASVAAPLNQFKVPPLMPVLMDAYQLSLSQAGMLMSIFALTGLILALPAGIIMQKLGPKTAGVLAVSCLVVGSAWGALASSANMLLASRVIEGIGMGLIAVVAPASIAMWFPREKRGTPMGIWATWVPVGTVMMYNLAPALGTAAGWRVVWWFGAGFALAALVLYGLLMRLPPSLAGVQESSSGSPTDEAPPKLREGLANRNIWLLALEFGCFNLVFISFGTFFPTFLSVERGYPLAQAAFISSIGTMVVLGSAPLAGWVSDRLGSRKLVYTIPFAIITVMLLFPFHLTGWQLPVFMVILGILTGAIPTATFTAVPEVMGKPQLAGIGMAVLMVGQNMGMFIGPAAFGIVVEATSWATAGYLLIPVSIVGIVAGWMVKVR